MLADFTLPMGIGRRILALNKIVVLLARQLNQPELYLISLLGVLRKESGERFRSPYDSRAPPDVSAASEFT